MRYQLFSANIDLNQCWLNVYLIHSTKIQCNGNKKTESPSAKCQLFRRRNFYIEVFRETYKKLVKCHHIEYYMTKFAKLYLLNVQDMKLWRHQMVPFSALLALCAGNLPVTGEFPAQRPVTQSFYVFFDLRLNKRLCKQSWGWWFETPSCPLWRHCNKKKTTSRTSQFASEPLMRFGTPFQILPHTIAIWTHVHTYTVGTYNMLVAILPMPC